MNAIDTLQTTLNAVREAEKNVLADIKPRFDKLVLANDIDGLFALMLTLPPSWRFCRTIRHHIYRLSGIEF